MKLTIFTSLIFAFLIFFGINLNAGARVLSVDIGQMRIKAAVIDFTKLNSPEELKEIQITTLPAREYLPGRLADIKNKGEEAFRADMKFPLRLREKLEQLIGKPVVLENNAIGSMEGFVFWDSHIGHEVSYPVLQISFGEGISASYALTAGTGAELQISSLKADWKPLAKVLNKPIQTSSWTHGRMRDAFLKGDHKQIVRAINQFINTVLTQLEKDGHPVNTLIIGGGFSNLFNQIDLDLSPQFKHVYAVILSNDNLKDQGINPDLIPLLSGYTSSYSTSAYDQAKTTITKGSQPKKNPLDIASFVEKAKLFSAKPQPFNSPSSVMLNYILDILNNPEFQADPKAFMADWREKRGYTEEFRYPEDSARDFFEKEVIPNIPGEDTILIIENLLYALGLMRESMSI